MILVALVFIGMVSVIGVALMLVSPFIPPLADFFDILFEVDSREDGQK